MPLYPVKGHGGKLEQIPAGFGQEAEYTLSRSQIYPRAKPVEQTDSALLPHAQVLSGTSCKQKWIATPAEQVATPQWLNNLTATIFIDL